MRADCLNKIQETKLFEEEYSKRVVMFYFKYCKSFRCSFTEISRKDFFKP